MQFDLYDETFIFQFSIPPLEFVSFAMEPMLRYLITTFVSESPQVRPAAIQVLNIGTSATEGSAIATEQTMVRAGQYA
jgi:hypothetical protein